ncbi:hypothetical protein [Haloparvum sp. PAK95]|uniref:hypothetical protein n=1 Tax=Haloparvum sp. PAK95 TaxID=3418962 RepID=UPI003D2EFC89
MRVRQRQLVYGSIIGASTFLVGWAATYLLTPADLLAEYSRWKVTLWVYLSAHFVKISGIHVGGLGAAFTEVDLIKQLPLLHSLRVLPLLLTVLGGVLVVETVNYTERLWYLLQNSSSLLLGYLGAGLLAFVVSEAQPGVAAIVLVGGVLCSTLFIGATLAQYLTGNLPIFGVVSLGGVIGIGLLVIIGGVAVLQSVGPLLAVATTGTVLGAILAWLARNSPP